MAKATRAFAALSFGALTFAAAARPPLQPDAPTAPPGIRTLAFSPDGKLLAAAAGETKEAGQLTVWDLASRKTLFIHREKVGVPSVAFSPDGKTLAIGGFTEFAKLLDAGTGKVLRELPGHGAAARGVAFSPDGRTLAVASYDKFIKLWDVAGGAWWKVLPAHDNWVYCVAFTRNGKFLASSSSDNHVKLWDPATDKALHTFAFDSIVRA